ncbi:hypothetical protein D3C87_1734110 [compost metagenome]
MTIKVQLLISQCQCAAYSLFRKINPGHIMSFLLHIMCMTAITAGYIQYLTLRLYIQKVKQAIYQGMRLFGIPVSVQ